jgi:SAM-dependent methyltransferase
MAESALKTGAQTYSSAIETADNYTRWVLGNFAPYLGRRILEVGLGHGGYRRFLPAEAQYTGLDIDSASVAAARERNPGDSYVAADVTDAEALASLRPMAIDTVLCINVLEHIEQDSQAAENLLALLRPGGHLLVLVPAFSVLYSDLDRMAGHVRRYTLRDAARLAADGGQVVLRRYFNAVGGVGWLVNKAFRHSSLDSGAVNAQIQLFDRFVVPVAKAVDLLARPFFGQSMVCVIRKP